MGRVTASGRVFMRDGQRWFWMADTAWKLWIKGTREEVDEYLDLRVSQGFTAFQAVAIRGGQSNAFGDSPGSPSNPNDSYFQHVDYTVEAARDRGLVVVMLPVWANDQILNEGDAFGYGQYLANRYASFDNIIWMLGGDHSADGEEDIWRNLADGLDAGPSGSQNIKTYHPAGRTSSTEWFNSDAWIDFHSIQTGAYTTWSTARGLEDEAHGNNGSRPWLNAEPFYEDHNINWDNGQGWAPAIYARRDAYWAVLAGAAGHTYGCWPVVHFAREDGDPYDGVHGPYEDWLDVEGTNDMRHVRRLFESRPRLEPRDQLVDNPGSDTSFTPAAIAPDSSTLIAYLPSGGSRTIDLTGLSGSTCRPWWFDPRTGNVTQLSDRSSSGTDSFTSPTSGEDWVLVIDDVSAGFSAPGQSSAPEPPPEEEPPAEDPTFGTTIGSGGFRFYDANHTITHNYVQGVFGGNYQGPLLLDSGDAEGSSSNLSGHWRVVNALVERNVLVDNPEGVRVGDNYDSAPTGCTIRDNLVARAASGTAITQRIAPVNTTITGNEYFDTPGGAGLTRDSVGIWRKNGFGPRVSYLLAGDVGVTGDPDDTDGTGSGVPPDDGGDDPPPPSTDPDSAAGQFGWGVPDPEWSDEFNYEGTPDPDIWGLPGADWEGHNGNGTRDPERTTVTDGKMVMTGLANGSTGWIKHRLERQYGRYEIRSRSFANAPSNGNDYHPLHLIWPTSESRQNDGEYDWLENQAPGEQCAGHFIHYPHPGTSVVQQEGDWCMAPGVDLTEFHNFGLEWTPDHIRIFIDGEIIATYSGGANSVRRNIQDMPSGHVNIQLDNFDGTNQTPATFEMEWVRIYSLTPVNPPTSPKSVAPSGITSATRFGFPVVSGADTTPPPSGSHPTLLGSSDTVLPFTLGHTVSDGEEPPPAGGKTVSGAGNVSSEQAFGSPVLTVDAGPQTVRMLGLAPGDAYGQPQITVDAGPPAAPGGVLVPALFAVAADGTTLTPLPHWTKLVVSYVRNSPGTIRVEYPSGAPGFSTLDDNVSAYPLKALEVRIWVGGNSTAALGGWLTQKSGDDLTPGSVWTFTGHFQEWILEKALVAPQERSEANPKAELRFEGATAGFVLGTVMDQAQSRGALPLVTRDFTAEHDSNGQPWANTVSSLALAPKTTVAQVADKLAELGMIEYELTAARVWRAFNVGTRGVDRTGGTNPLTFAHAINLREHSRRESAKDAGTAVLAAGSEGFYEWAESATGEAELGWRAEVGADAGQLESQDAVQAFAATHLEAVRNGVAEFVGGIEFAPGAPLPFIDWGVDDWGFSWVGGKRRKLRIAQIGLEFAPGLPPKGTVALNDLITDKVALLYRRLNAISAGSAVVGTSTPTPGGAGEDRMPPAAPTGLTVSSTIAFQVPGETVTRALVTAGWAPVIFDAYADAVTADKAVAATLIADRMADAIAVGRIATDSESAGRVEAAQTIGNRLRRFLEDEEDSEIFEDWTWDGAPAVVTQHNDALLAEFHAAGFTGTAGTPEPAGEDPQTGDNITLSEAARDWLLDYEGPTSALYENWTWDGAPILVRQYASTLKEEFEDEYPDADDNRFPEQVAVLAQEWLTDYPLAHQGGGAVAEDVEHFRVQYAYLGPQAIDPTLPGAGPGQVAGSIWFEPVGSPTRSTSLTFGDIEGGRSLGVRVAAVDRSGNQGPWSAVVAVDTAVDDQPPPRPSKPFGVAWFRTIDWTWDGRGSAGEDMFAAAPDFADGGSVEIHVAQGLDFIPDRPVGADGKVDLGLSTTFVAHLYGAGTWNQPGLTVGTTYFARLVAVDRSGNASTPSESSVGVLPQQLVSIDYGPNTIEGIHIKNAAIGSAQIGFAAINSAHIEEVSAGLLSAGTMRATVTIGGRFETPVTNGNKLEFDATGIRLLRAGTVVGRWQVFDASMLVTGTYLSGLDGPRINLLPDGTLRFYPDVGLNYSAMYNFGSGQSADGPQVVWRGPRDNNGRSGRFNVNILGCGMNFSSETEVPANLRSEMAVFDRRTRTTAPLVVFEVDGRLEPPDGSTRRVQFQETDSANNVLPNSFLSYSTSSSTGRGGMWGNGAGWKLEGGVMIVTDDSLDSFGPIHTSDVVEVSSREAKRDIVDARMELDPIQVIRDAPARRFRYKDEAPTAPPRFGPLAEELPAVLQRLGPDAKGGTVKGVELGSMIGVLWAAEGEQTRRIDALTARIRGLSNTIKVLTARLAAVERSMRLRVAPDSITPAEAFGSALVTTST